MATKDFLKKEFILNHTLKPLQNLVLLFPKSETMSEGHLRAWSFKIASVSLIKIPYNSLLPDIPGNTAMLNAGGNPYYARITKTAFDDASEDNNYFHIPSNYPFLIYDFAIGISPEDMRMYKAYNGTPLRTLFQNEEIIIGDNHDFVDGQLSPLETPTRYARDIITKNISVRYGFYNDQEHEDRPSLNILGAMYAAVPYTDPAKARSVMMGGRGPREVFPVFGLREFSFNKPSEWPEAMEITEQDLQGMV